ncbi:MAG: hypothetical protein V7K92_26005 [Nostoc sp.]|uniref:hypothetical protein n=1 Tax=Nostoc sp. TaxID=1180 RepID=UPI002FEF63EE
MKAEAGTDCAKHRNVLAEVATDCAKHQNLLAEAATGCAKHRNVLAEVPTGKAEAGTECAKHRNVLAEVAARKAEVATRKVNREIYRYAKGFTQFSKIRQHIQTAKPRLYLTFLITNWYYSPAFPWFVEGLDLSDRPGSFPKVRSLPP